MSYIPTYRKLMVTAPPPNRSYSAAKRNGTFNAPRKWRVNRNTFAELQIYEYLHFNLRISMKNQSNSRFLAKLLTCTGRQSPVAPALSLCLHLCLSARLGTVPSITVCQTHTVLPVGKPATTPSPLRRTPCQAGEQRQSRRCAVSGAAKRAIHPLEQRWARTEVMEVTEVTEVARGHVPHG